MAITTATIQHRRGNLDDINPDKMVPGELAFTTDGSRKVFAAFAPGDYKELASTEEVQEIVDEFNETVQSKIDDAVESIEQKTEESLARIPEFENKANVIEVDMTGETIAATDTSDDKFRGLNVYGKSIQETTTGAQLIKYPFDWSGEVGDGVTFTDNGDGTITVNGTAGESSSVYIMSLEGFFEVGERYTVVDTTIIFVGVRRVKTMETFTVTEEDLRASAIKVEIRPDKGTVYSNTVLKPMLCKGSIALPWEPYTGGIASPNPQYPQEIINCENPEVSVYGKNIAHCLSTKTVNHKGLTFALIENSSECLISGTSDTENSIALISDNELPAGTYTISVYGLNISDSLFDRLYVLEKKTSKVLANYIQNGKPATFTITENALIDVVMVFRAGSTYNNTIIKIHIEKGSQSTEYEPYKEKQSLTIPYTLCGIPVTDASIANYTDENGQMWVCDEVDFERGVLVQRIGMFNTANLTSVSASSVENVEGKVFLFVPDVLIGSVDAYCNKRVVEIGVSTGNIKPGTLHIKRTGADINAFYLVLNNANTDAEALNVLKAEASEIVYILATPIETPLTAEQIAACASLHTNYPNTTVMNDCGAGMRVKYGADTKNHIEQNYVSKETYNALNDRLLAVERTLLS